MRITVFGGSFNPPHIGHIEAARAAIEELKADKMIVIPAAKAPQKEYESDSPDALSRFAMTELAFKGAASTEVSDMELVRGGVSYTIDTLLKLREMYPGDRLFLLIGADQFLNFESWKEYRRIVEICTLAPFPRRGGDMAEVRKSAEKLKERCGADVRIVEFVPTDISSTELRAILPLRRGSGYFRDEVYSEIIKHRWYGAKPEFSWLREKAYAYLDPKRVPHVMGCEQEAVRLAKRWGADEETAAEAGILHDITKKLKLDGQLKLCERYGIMTDIDERANYKLLHAKTGAALSRDLFGITDEVYGAIYWHTTGKADMSLLEKIIYMADYIEPTRDFPGVQELRSMAYSDLDQAIVLGLKMSMDDLKQHGVKPHKNSIEAMDWLNGCRK